MAGVAWATPAIALASAAPAVAASLPPCVASITDSGINWVVDNAVYPGCTTSTYRCHRDVRLSFVINPCNEAVRVRLAPVSGKAQWCAWSSNYYEMTKTVAANSGQTTLHFPDTGDVIPTSGGAGCTIVAHTDGAVNDGIHVNGCQSNQLVYYVKVGATETGPYYYNTPIPVC